MTFSRWGVALLVFVLENNDAWGEEIVCLTRRHLWTAPNLEIYQMYSGARSEQKRR